MFSQEGHIFLLYAHLQVVLICSYLIARGMSNIDLLSIKGLCPNKDPLLLRKPRWESGTYFWLSPSIFSYIFVLTKFFHLPPSNVSEMSFLISTNASPSVDMDPDLLCFLIYLIPAICLIIYLIQYLQKLGKYVCEFHCTKEFCVLTFFIFGAVSLGHWWLSKRAK